MPPRIKVTKEEIVRTAVDILRQGGIQAVNARSIAAALNCSTQPVFFNFATMEDLHRAIAVRAEALCRDFIKQETESGAYPPYKAAGMAYIRFAKEEKELFKLLYMYDRQGAPIPKEADLFNQMESLVQHTTGLHSPDARLFHLEMWVYVHGIATMFATGYLNLDWELVSQMITDVYQGLRKHYEAE